MKRSIIVLFLVLLVILFCTCNHASAQVSLHQPVDQIVQVILVDNTGVNNGIAPINLLVLDEKDEIYHFIESLQNIKCGKFFNDPSVNYGYLYIEIHYTNGDSEIIGTDSFQYNSVAGTIQENYNGWLYAEFDSMCDLFKEYTGVEPTLPTRTGAVLREP